MKTKLKKKKKELFQKQEIAHTIQKVNKFNFG